MLGGGEMGNKNDFFRGLFFYLVCSCPLESFLIKN